MKTIKTQSKVEKTTQEVNLVEGLFTPSEANQVVNALIDQKINFHKFQKWSMCEGHEGSDVTYENSRIEELINEKQVAKDYISIARKEGYNVVINGTLNITFVK